MQTVYDLMSVMTCAEGREPPPSPDVAAATWLQAGITTATGSISLRMPADDHVSLFSHMPSPPPLLSLFFLSSSPVVQLMT